MTYRELIEHLKTHLNEEQLDQQVFYYSYIDDKYVDISFITFTVGDDTEDIKDGHPILI